MAITAWYMDDDESIDQRHPHSPTPSVSVSIEQLAALGVLSWSELEGAGWLLPLFLILPFQY